LGGDLRIIGNRSAGVVVNISQIDQSGDVEPVPGAVGGCGIDGTVEDGGANIDGAVTGDRRALPDPGIGIVGKPTWPAKLIVSTTEVASTERAPAKLELTVAAPGFGSVELPMPAVQASLFESPGPVALSIAPSPTQAIVLTLKVAKFNAPASPSP
jgi:hypothetical protein